jgi:hypothetical protein
VLLLHALERSFLLNWAGKHHELKRGSYPSNVLIRVKCP